MPFGRATLGMKGWDIEANRMVYIKDYWRAEGGEKEGDIYLSLEEKNVPKTHIVPAIKSGDHEICENNVSQERHETESQPKNHNGLVPGQALSDIIEWL